MEHSGEEIAEVLNAGLFSPPGNTCQMAESANSKYGRIIFKYVTCLFYVLSFMPVAHGNIFCSALWFKK